MVIKFMLFLYFSNSVFFFLTSKIKFEFFELNYSNFFLIFIKIVFWKNFWKKNSVNFCFLQIVNWIFYPKTVNQFFFDQFKLVGTLIFFFFVN